MTAARRPSWRLTSPHNILSAYSAGRIGAPEAMAMLHVDMRGLVVAMLDAGHRLPPALPASGRRAEGRPHSPH